MRHYLHGLGLKQEPFGPTLAFSSTSGPSLGTIDDLTARVKRMITAAAKLDLPDEPPLPALTIRSPAQLGTLTAERKRLHEAAIEEAEGKKPGGDDTQKRQAMASASAMLDGMRQQIETLPAAARQVLKVRIQPSRPRTLCSVAPTLGEPMCAN